MVTTLNRASDNVTRQPLVDNFGRRIDHLRMSVTSACDLQCVYCHPDRSGGVLHESTAMSDAQRVEFIRFLHERHGLSQVRLTGGEPLLYPRLPRLVSAIREACPDLTLAITTNGRRLPRLEPGLYRRFYR